VSYAFNLNLGTLIGGFAFRYRLYSRLGLRNAAITRVLGLSLATNWLGYCALAGGVFALRILSPPEDWRISAAALQALGLLLWGVVSAYVLLCAVAKRREYSWRGHDITVPPLGMALTQLVVSCANWLTIAALIFVLLQQQVPYAQVLGVLLIGAIAGVVTHIPAGLGVLEAVFVTLLAPPLAPHAVLAALLVYRVFYYLTPLLLASGMYMMLEARSRQTRAQGA
jgi:uncharacterized membrane protein YbhN (UPF0104 family)